MSEFKLDLTALTEARDHEDPRENRWKKTRPPDMVLFATDGQGVAMILDYIGPGVSYYMEDSLLTSMLREEMAEHKVPGIWMWSGHLRSSRSYYGEYDEWLEGDVRALTDEEREYLKNDDYVWDPELWYAPLGTWVSSHCGKTEENTRSWQSGIGVEMRCGCATWNCMKKVNP